jgi:hypothetical protein
MILHQAPLNNRIFQKNGNLNLLHSSNTGAAAPLDYCPPFSIISMTSKHAELMITRTATSQGQSKINTIPKSICFIHWCIMHIVENIMWWCHQIRMWVPVNSSRFGKFTSKWVFSFEFFIPFSETNASGYSSETILKSDPWVRHQLKWSRNYVDWRQISSKNSSNSLAPMILAPTSLLRHVC